MKKLLFVALGCLAIGFLAGGLRNIKSSSMVANDSCETLATAKTDLISISEKDYIEYTQIKDMKQKYEKADELLGRIMLLFLADVGFKYKKAIASELETSTTPLEISKTADSTNASVATWPAYTAAATPTPSTRPDDLANKSQIIRDLNSKTQIKSVLDKALIENPNIELAKAQSLHPEQIRFLSTTYTGQVHFLDPKKDPLDITWELITEPGTLKLTGEFNLTIRGQGRNSETRGKGDVSHIGALAADPNGIIVNACGDSCYFQMYYNAAFDQFVGNYYEIPNRESKKFNRTGTIELKH